MKRIIKILLAVVVVSLIASCASQKKCDGRRGVRTSMGLM